MCSWAANEGEKKREKKSACVQTRVECNLVNGVGVGARAA